MIHKADRYIVNGNKLIIGYTEIVFDFPIKSYTEIQGMLIILLAIPIDVEYNENVFGVDIFSREIKWQIEKRQYIPAYKQQCPFISVVLFEKEVRLNNWCSVCFIVDPKTGEVLREEETR
jgi:hypothetical protein